VLILGHNARLLRKRSQMLFDRETMPDWMKIPDPKTLPDKPFEVDYVRSYRRKTD